MPTNSSNESPSPTLDYVGLYRLALCLFQPHSAREAAQLILEQTAAITNAQGGAMIYGELSMVSDAALASELDIAAIRLRAELARAPDGEMALELSDAAGLSDSSELLVGILERGEDPPGILILKANPGFIPGARQALREALPLIRSGIEQALQHDRRRSEEASREQMINLLVHDIRSPLVATHASFEVVQRLLRSADVSPAVFDALQTGLNSVRSAVDLCNDLLEVKRLQSGYRIEHRPVHIASLTEEVVRMLRSLTEPRGVQVSQQVKPDDLLVSGDLRLLRRVLINLLSNALRFAPSKGGQIDIEVWAEDEAVRLQVSDNGPGVPVSDRERIFEPFVQGSGEVGRGAGLGLAFCREVALAHSGQIWVEERPGGGCRFGLRLPAHAG